MLFSFSRPSARSLVSGGALLSPSAPPPPSPLFSRRTLFLLSLPLPLPSLSHATHTLPCFAPLLPPVLHSPHSVSPFPSLPSLHTTDFATSVSSSPPLFSLSHSLALHASHTLRSSSFLAVPHPSASQTKARGSHAHGPFPPLYFTPLLVLASPASSVSVSLVYSTFPKKRCNHRHQTRSLTRCKNTPQSRSTTRRFRLIMSARDRDRWAHAGSAHERLRKRPIATCVAIDRSEIRKRDEWHLCRTWERRWNNDGVDPVGRSAACAARNSERRGRALGGAVAGERRETDSHLLAAVALASRSISALISALRCALTASFAAAAACCVLSVVRL